MRAHTNDFYILNVEIDGTHSLALSCTVIRATIFDTHTVESRVKYSSGFNK